MPCEEKKPQEHPKKTLQRTLQDKEKQNTVTVKDQGQRKEKISRSVKCISQYQCETNSKNQQTNQV